MHEPSFPWLFSYAWVVDHAVSCRAVGVEFFHFSTLLILPPKIPGESANAIRAEIRPAIRAAGFRRGNPTIDRAADFLY